MTVPPPISLILVEDNRLLREGLAAMVSRQEDLRIVAALGDRENVLQKVQQLKPRVVLLDLGLRNHNSLRLVEAITKEHPSVKVIVMDLLPAEAGRSQQQGDRRPVERGDLHGQEPRPQRAGETRAAQPRAERVLLCQRGDAAG